MKRYQDDFKASIVKRKDLFARFPRNTVFLQPQFITGLKALNQLS
ncbi:hypothetical protein IMAU60049_03009 [Lactiplantibacillus plantarum]|nr:hypothetical protein [Lactiplantibacillus plantarum]MCG0694672.1 hypothetical protein [Lactiplantibacillus plantarum]MCG0758522.1 hypothetical protein [Lactiplantibacillus plantarum]MCG0811093.1 hypothetical protein [Lactiplantibacillus plantarum]